MSIKKVFLQTGTKIEANANNYTFLCKKVNASDKENERVAARYMYLCQSAAASEDNLPEPPDLTTINNENVQD